MWTHELLIQRTNSKLTCFIKEEGILILLHVLRGSGLIQEQRVNSFNVFYLNLCALQKTNGTNRVNVTKLKKHHTQEAMDVIHVQLLKSFTLSLPCVYDTPALRCWSAGSRSAVTFPCRYEWGLCEPPRSAPHPPPHTWNGNLSFTFHLRQKMEASADYEHAFLPDLQDLLRLFFGVRGGGDDEQPIEEIDGDAVRALIVCSTDSAGRRVSSTLLMKHPNYSVLPLLKRKAD